MFDGQTGLTRDEIHIQEQHCIIINKTLNRSRNGINNAIYSIGINSRLFPDYVLLYGAYYRETGVR